MPQDSEQQVRLQFLEEAQDYLHQIEAELLNFESQGNQQQALNAMLRAAHSIKGGAGLMGFPYLSQFAHRFEDFLKVLKVSRPAVDSSLEQELLRAVDDMGQVATAYRQHGTVAEDWVQTAITPIFDRLHQRLGDPQPEDAAALLSEEVGEDMTRLLFESEVEACLQRLEAVTQQPEMPCLVEEVEIAAQELAGLAEMLDLSAFQSLCQSVSEQLQAAPTPTQGGDIAQLAIQQWRRSQALVLVGQATAIPTQLEREAIPHETPIQSVSKGLPDWLDTHLSEPDLPESLTASEAVSLLADLETDFEAGLETGVEAPLSRSAPQQSAPGRVLSPQKAALESEFSEPSVTPGDTEQTIRVPVHKLSQLSELFGELIIERNGLSLQLQRLRDLMGLLNQRVQTLEQSNDQLRSACDSPRLAYGHRTTAQGELPQLIGAALSGISATLGERFDGLEMDRYSELHLFSQELSETAVQIQEVTTDMNLSLEDAEQTARALTRTSKQLQSTMTQVRMRPLSDLLSRIPRVLRDLSHTYGKQVDLNITGGSTLIDRAILEALHDPLIHLLRNAFDHGIEPPHIRTAQGKPEQGLIEIKAAYRGNQTVLILQDDGAGIDLDKIKARALMMGLDDAVLNRASTQELLELIFEPGFSTADQVTDLSGRGVGMDVVRTQLKQVRGNITVDTRPGQGTTMTLTVPFTLSVLRVLLVEVQQMLLAIPTNAVEEMVLLASQQLRRQTGRPLLNWEGLLVPLLNLKDWLRMPRVPHLPESDASPTIDEPLVLMVAHGEDIMGLQVDRYWGEQEVTIRPVEGQLPLPPGFVGCTILGNGRIVPLVEPVNLLRWIEEQQAQSPTQSLTMPPTPITTAPSTPLILIVDDSVNVRRFLALTLEKAGYRVEQAKDGHHALEKLRAGLSAQAVICDIEMPRLDGYGFLAHARADQRYQSLPILMLTSRSGHKHRQLAMTLGATAYFSKPFQETELLATLQQVIANPMLA
ncbi:response regulator [Synechococcales cyanobacterium C]|uniref:histidine kinase n=1 Tax=Petrachloros mirabilis ULC683 TaxID=2781853 RepID=A0A8K1ZYG2_9CYAN|nr:response regulator [Petrachloros mirabilis]NCJ06462.1 response regulator [Petrachloros mirabilis ULC683]